MYLFISWFWQFLSSITAWLNLDDHNETLLLSFLKRLDVGTKTQIILDDGASRRWWTRELVRVSRNSSHREQGLIFPSQRQEILLGVRRLRSVWESSQTLTGIQIESEGGIRINTSCWMEMKSSSSVCLGSGFGKVFCLKISAFIGTKTSWRAGLSTVWAAPVSDG